MVAPFVRVIPLVGCPPDPLRPNKVNVAVLKLRVEHLDLRQDLLVGDVGLATVVNDMKYHGNSLL